MRFLRSIVAVVLLAAWPALTSHALLEHLGVIHHAHADHHHHADGSSHQHNPDDHDFADGGYLAKTSSKSASLRADVCLYQTAWLTALLQTADLPTPGLLGPAPPGLAPPELLQRWNFLLRASAEARAPSSLV